MDTIQPVTNLFVNAGETLGSIKQPAIMHYLYESKACMFSDEIVLYFRK